MSISWTYRCYKLGKKRWSYNQCALVIQNAVSGDSMEVVDCMQYGPNPLTPEEQVPHPFAIILPLALLL